MNDDIDAQFCRKGFLAEGMAEEITLLRQNHDALFRLAEDLSECLQTMAVKAMAHVKGKTLDANVLATFVLLRSTSLVQAAILLAERGMVVEARMMVRSLLESGFCIVAIHRDPQKFVELFRSDDMASRKGQAKVILEKGLAAPDSEMGKKVNAFLSALEKGTRYFDINDLASQGPLASQYLLYKVLSNDSAHVSATSLRRHLDMAPDKSGWIGYVLGPAADPEIAQTLDYLVLAGIPIGLAFTEMVGDGAGNADLAAIAERRAVLQGR